MEAETLASVDQADDAATSEPTAYASNKMEVEESMSKLATTLATSPAPAPRHVPTPARSPYPASVACQAAETASPAADDDALSSPPTKRRRLFYKQSPPAEYSAVTSKVPPKRPAHMGKSSAAKQAQAKATNKVIMTTAGYDLEPETRHYFKKTLKVRLVDYFSANVTHVIADTFRASTKLMCAISSGAKILSSKYITACMEAQRLVEESEFLLNDAAAEEGFAETSGLKGYSVQAALQQRRKNGPVLSGTAVHCAMNVPGRQDLKALVEAMGGKWLAKAPRGEPNERQLLVADPLNLCDRDKERLRLGLLFSPDLLKEAACTQALRCDAHRLEAGTVSDVAASQDASSDSVAAAASTSVEDAKLDVLLPAL